MRICVRVYAYVCVCEYVFDCAHPFHKVKITVTAGELTDPRVFVSADDLCERLPFLLFFYSIYYDILAVLVRADSRSFDARPHLCLCFTEAFAAKALQNKRNYT